MSAAEPAALFAGVRVLRDRYVDSVELLAITRRMREAEGVDFATALMGTPANVEALQEEGVVGEALTATPNDLVLAARATDAAQADGALEQAEQALSSSPSAVAAPAEREPRSLQALLDGPGDPNVAIVSVAGEYAALEAHKALAAGLHVLLFSDNVSVEEEISLKDHAASVGRLAMGPGAGTASIGGCGLGFANAVAPGRVGVVAAAGTGAQEVMALLDRWGEGVSHVIGVGGRDLSAQVAGRSARLAMQALARDPATDVIVLVSKPPSPDVAREVVAAGGATPVIAALIGLAPGTSVPGAAAVSATLEAAVARAVRQRGGCPPSDWSEWRSQVADSLVDLRPARRAVRGLFSGGTLCYEALTLLQHWLGDVWSNTPLDDRLRVPAPAGAHICLDLGDEEYTRGRPHPMIDAEARLGLLAEAGNDDDVAVVLLDVVLGYGGHDDPASVLAPACAAVAGPRGPRVVVYVLGTEKDPQRLTRQRRAFEEAGCLVAPTAARAALAAARDRTASAGHRRGRSVVRPVGMVTYSTKPRGGVVHLLALAEALARRSFPTEIIALGDERVGFHRPVAVPCSFVAPPEPAPELEARVFDAIDALEAGLVERAGALPPVLHVQDCIAARAAMRVRDRGAPVRVVRTVHHVDDFTTPALVECQRRSILDPDRVLVVSRTWQQRLADEYGVKADVVTNGVDVDRFAAAPAPGMTAALRARAGAEDRFLILTVGGIEPRKGTDHLFRALSLLRRRWAHPPVLAMIGGHSFQDHTPYREPRRRRHG